MIALFLLAIVIIYVAFHTPELQIVTDMTEEELQDTEFKTSQAILFFFGASCMLLFLFLFIDKISTILILFVTIGISFSTMLICQEVLSRCFNTRNLPQYGPQDFKFNIIDILSFLLALTIAISWLVTQNWVLNNILGINICLIAMKTLRLNQLLPGAVLLTLLFFYDIFWVFYSPKFTKGGKSVMVEVAT